MSCQIKLLTFAVEVFFGGFLVAGIWYGITTYIVNIGRPDPYIGMAIYFLLRVYAGWKKLQSQYKS
jgi:hypothetical protein